MKIIYKKNVPVDKPLEQDNNIENPNTKDNNTLSDKCIYCLLIFLVLFIVLINVFD